MQTKTIIAAIAVAFAGAASAQEVVKIGYVGRCPASRPTWARTTRAASAWRSKT